MTSLHGRDARPHGQALAPAFLVARAVYAAAARGVALDLRIGADAAVVQAYLPPIGTAVDCAAAQQRAARGKCEQGLHARRTAPGHAYSNINVPGPGSRTVSRARSSARRRTRPAARPRRCGHRP